MRIIGVNIPDNKRIEIALTYIFGIGRSLSRQILQNLNIDLDKKPVKLTTKEKASLIKELEKRKIEGILRQEVADNIKRLKRIDCYRGVRHKKGLPVRGQQTQTNNRTVRGNVRKTMFSGKRSLTKT